MAPRAEPTPRKDNRNSDGTRNRQYLNARTGAGVNANRTFALGGRGSTRTTATYRHGSHENQRGYQRRPPTSTPGGRLLELLQSNDDGRHRSQVEDDGSSDAGLHAQHDCFQQCTSTNATTHDTRASSGARDSVMPMNLSGNASPTQQSNSTSFTPQAQPQQSSILRSPNDLHIRPNTFMGKYRSNGTYNGGLSFNIAPPRRALPTKPYSGNDPVKRAFTNPNLRAIMSDKAYPKQRKKALVERPILKMGIKKEYK